MDIDIFNPNDLAKLEKFIKQIEKDYKKAFKDSCTEVLNKTLEQVQENAVTLVLGDGVYNDEFVDAVNGNEKKVIRNNGIDFEGEVYNETEDSAYAEFGTGLVGMSDPHFMSSPSGWKYAMNPDRDYSKGWYYSRNGLSHHTYGLPSSQYMYLASLDIEKNFKEIFDKQLKERLSKY